MMKCPNASGEAAGQPDIIFSEQRGKQRSWRFAVASLSRDAFSLHLAVLFISVGIAQGRRMAAAAGSQGPRSLTRIAVCHPTLSQQLQPGGTPGGRLAELSLEQLGDLEVTTVSKKPEAVWRAPAAIFVITQEDIRRSGATSIPEVLRLAPGVEVARIDSDHWSVGIRGFGSQLSRSLLVLIDGRSVYTPLYAGVYWQVQDTLLEDVDRIEVIRGPGGTIWGANAVNGVINIITKSAKDTRGTRLTVGGGNVDHGATGFRYGGGKGRDFNYRLYGKAFGRGPEFHADDRNFDSSRSGQAGFRADWETPHHDGFTLQGDTYSEDAGESVAFGTLAPPFTATVDGAAELSGGNILGRWRRTLNEGSSVQLQAYYDRTNHFEPQFGESRDTFDIDFLHNLSLSGHQNLLWGLGARWSPGEFAEIVPTIDFTPHRQTDTIYSAFVQDEISLVHNQVELTIGSKFEHNNYTGFEAQPNARLLWKPGPRRAFWAAVTRAVRTPSRVEENLQLTGLLATAPLTFLSLVGDGRFFSEQLVGYEIGYRSLLGPTLYVGVAAFYNDYDHLLSLEPGTPFSAAYPGGMVVPYSIRNGLLGTSSGVEIAPDWKPRRWWRLEGSYSYLHLDLKRRRGSLDPSTVNSTEGSSPHNQLAFESFLDLPRNLEFDQFYRYVSGLPAQGVGSYETAGARFGWRPRRYLEFSVTGDNLLQPYHAEFGGDPGPLVEVKRSAYGEIVVHW